MRFIFLIFFFLFCYSQVSAQILKVNKGSLASDSSDYFIGVIDGTFALNNRSSTAEVQNVYVGVNTNLDVVYVAKQSATLLISGLNYFKIGDSPAIYNGSSHLRHILRRAAKLTPEFYTQVQFDESRNMSLRYLAGAGYRWNILEKKNMLYCGLGVFNEHERWAGEQETIVKNLWKVNTYLSGDVKITQTTNINAIGYFQSGYDQEVNSFRNRFSGQIEIKNALNAHLKVKLSGQFLWDDQPIIPLNEFIYQTFVGLEYAFN